MDCLPETDKGKARVAYQDRRNKRKTSEHERVLKIADKISKETSWIYANFEILKAARTEDVQKNLLNTYAGKAWVVIQKSLHNEIMIALARILTEDKDNRVSALNNISEYIKNEDNVSRLRENYKQAEGTFDYRFQLLKDQLEKIHGFLKGHNNLVKSLLIYRKDFLAHNAQTPKLDNKVKWGDEKELIQLLREAVDPMEHIFLNAGNISGCVISSYKLYAEDFWLSFIPNQDNHST
tara:strand:+ start:702 stop:1412 length:711 start_codon:yes stop_codon:yes gene_type:complete